MEATLYYVELTTCFHCFQGDECHWRIIATHGEKIVLNITSLDIPSFVSSSSSSGNDTAEGEEEEEGPLCSEDDMLEVRDGYWHRSPLLGARSRMWWCLVVWGKLALRAFPK